MTSERPALAKSEPDLSAESTPTGGWCQMKQASIFTVFRKYLIVLINSKFREIWSKFSKHSAKFCQILRIFINKSAKVSIIL
jgi:hypothetical protein